MLWAAPTLSGARTTEKPNIIFYVIDGGGADLMSLYGYNHRTTPNLERIAAEGAPFDYAYSNSTWTGPSTLSFLMSLQHSVLGGLRNARNMAPEGVLTIAQHLRRVGYQTAFFTSNPNAGTMSGLERGIDVLRGAGVGNSSASSVELHADFWWWREAYPAEPYWVRFQTTDVHSPNIPVPPFAGLYVSPERRATYHEWGRELDAAGGSFPYSDAYEKSGIDRQEFFDIARGLYDETMAHQDYQIGRFVERLKAAGEWENTVLIVAAARIQSHRGVAATRTSTSGSWMASRSSTLASPICCRRRRIFFRNARDKRVRTRRGVDDGSLLQSGSFPSTAESVSGTVSPSNVRLPGQRFVETTAECPDVGAPVDAFSPCLLGAHVRGGSEDGTERGVSCERGRLRIACHGTFGLAVVELRESEVENLRLSIRFDLDVRRLQVPMQDPLLVSRLESLGDMNEQGERFFRG